jgi:hypothetical protein
VNEKVGLGMTVANLQKNEIHMLAIREYTSSLGT